LQDSKYSERDLDGSIEESLRLMNDWFADQTGGRSFVLDTYQGRLDITYMPIPLTEQGLLDYTYKTYYGQYNKGFSESNYLSYALEDFVYHANLPIFKQEKLYLAYFEISKAYTCGEYGSTRSAHVAVVYPSAFSLRDQINCSIYSNEVGDNTRGIWENILAHEVIHSLGFVEYGCALNGTPDHHVEDPETPDDIMGIGMYSDNPVLDPNHNDYYEKHRPYCADLADSPYLYP
jgi:hypothetical protein